MRYLVIDTETSGLIQYRDLAGNTIRSDDPSQPHLAQLAMIRVSADLTIEDEFSGYIRPEHWEMDAEATRVNGLTTEFLAEHGLPVGEVLDRFTRAILEEGRIGAAFNAQFDFRAVRGALRRAGHDDLFEKTPQTCLMRGMGAFNKATGGSGKWPSLEDVLHQIGYEREGAAHDALSDARAAVAVLRFLHEHDALIPPKVHYARALPAGDDAALKAAAK